MSQQANRRLAAIVAADVAGYSRLVGIDEEGTVNALRSHRRELIDPLLAEHQGRIANTAGDSLLMEFPSAVDAVRCAVALQQGMAARNAANDPERRIVFRIGINVGDVLADGDDLLGDGVNIAARIEAICQPGGIMLSDDAYRHVRDRLDLRWIDAGQQPLKNIARPVQVWRWNENMEGSETGAPTAESPGIAVLPLDNMSGDREQDYFSDGITEDIITELSKIHGLMVISRTSTFTYKGKPTKAQEVSRDLGVRYILEGSVRKAGGRVRITAQLIDGRTGGHVWAERYDRELADIFAVQDDVTERIVRALEVKLIASDRPTRTEPENPDAYDCVLRGREQYRLYTKESNQAARHLFERAIALDPNYAAAHAGLAETYLHDWFFGAPEALERAYDSAQTALKLDGSLPLVYEALASAYLFKRQHDDAVAAARRWVEIEPGNADAHANLAGIYHFAGEPERVEGLIETARRLNPYYPFYYTLYVGQACFTMRRFDDAARTIQRSIAHNPESLPSYFYLAACYGQMGEDDKARDALAEVRRISPDFTMAQARSIAAYRRAADLDLLTDGLRRAGLPE